MPAERGTPGPSVQEKEDETARFPMPAQNPANGIDEEANLLQEDVMDEDGADMEENENDENMMRDVITVECKKLNGKPFIGTVNYSETKIKVFQDGLGLDTKLLGTVKIGFNKCPVITFKLKSKINVSQSIIIMQIISTKTMHW